jgi:hypothetical protein
MHEVESAITDSEFKKLRFLDQREKNVFYSYLKAFSFLFYSDGIKQIIEIGAGHSTLIFSFFAKRTGCQVKTIDMNPEAIIGKLRNQSLVDSLDNIEFIRGASVSCENLLSYYENGISSINGIRLNEVLKNVDPFINLKMDNRKEFKVTQALDIKKLNSKSLLQKFNSEKLFTEEFLKIYRTDFDELAYCESHNSNKGVLESLLADGETDMVFLDSGEFVSLVEWQIVSEQLRKGSYVCLHDIYFPKSYKNWLVCASIKASKDWEILYTDTTTPQGLMLAKKIF